MGYALLPTVPGLFEILFMTGGGTAMYERLAALWKQYYEEALGREIGGSHTPVIRVMPIEQTVFYRIMFLDCPTRTE